MESWSATALWLVMVSWSGTASWSVTPVWVQFSEITPPVCINRRENIDGRQKDCDTRPPQKYFPQKTNAPTRRVATFFRLVFYAVSLRRRPETQKPGWHAP